MYFDFLLFFLHRVLPSLGLMYPLCNVCLIFHFQGWSDLQKSDFVGVLANKMSDGDGGDIVDSVEALKINGDIINGDTKKPPSLYECQIKLFKVSCNVNLRISFGLLLPVARPVNMYNILIVLLVL